jgi:hypothetical protein
MSHFNLYWRSIWCKCVSCNGSFLLKSWLAYWRWFTKKPKHVKACSNNKCNLITLGGLNEVVLIVATMLTFYFSHHHMLRSVDHPQALLWIHARLSDLNNNGSILTIFNFEESIVIEFDNLTCVHKTIWGRSVVVREK